MGALFGTDGIRGKAGRYPMDAETAMAVGRAVARFFGNHGASSIVIGRDTRISGHMIESAVTAGVLAEGASVWLAGVLPTPGVACLARDRKSDAGVVISASHNPYYDNGIKLFGPDGRKLPDETEERIEALILSILENKATHGGPDPGAAHSLEAAGDIYIRFLLSAVPDDFRADGLKLVLDCSNGAASAVAPALFTRIGASVDPIFNLPDGKNINLDCGSQHIEALSRRVKETGANAGLAFDGDADRLIAVDENGEKLSGDQLLIIFAEMLHRKGRLPGDLVVSTVMSNMGFGLALRDMGLSHVAAAVGDRYVLADMERTGAKLGGEDSGHIIFADHHTTGDGLLSALKLVEAMAHFNAPLSELKGKMSVFPQLLVNVDVREKPEIDAVPEIRAAIEDAEKELGERGRVFVRYSGTQPKLRVMVEAPTMEETQAICNRVADVVRATLGR